MGIQRTDTSDIAPRFGSIDDPHALISTSAPGRSRLHAILLGDIDLYVTILAHPEVLAACPGPSSLIANPNWLVGRLSRTCVLGPRPGNEADFWEEGTRLFASRSPDTPPTEWFSRRCLLVMSG